MTDYRALPLEQLSLNEQERPVMPPIAQATSEHRRKGKHLAAIHRHYLAEMRKIGAILDRIDAGDHPPEALQAIVLHSQMARNFEAAGTICGQQCRVLQMHHDIEEHHMFPALSGVPDGALQMVVQKLKEEHKVIHALLDRLQSAADALVQSRDKARFDDAHAVFRALYSAVVSHFGYEETELEEAIGLYLDGI